MLNQEQLKNLLQKEVDKLVQKTKNNFKNLKKIALAEAWKILQLAIIDIIQAIEEYAKTLPGKDKKNIAMDLLSKFYDTTFIIVDVPVVPNVLEPIIHKYVKSLLMILVSSTIDAMVATLKDLGIFTKSDSIMQSSKLSKKTNKNKGKKK